MSCPFASSLSLMAEVSYVFVNWQPGYGGS